MRLSTNTIYAMGSQAILRQQSEVADIGQQLASGRRIVTPADDPRAAAQALNVSQAAQVNAQFADSREIARRSLSAEDNELDSVIDALTAAKPLFVQAGNGTLSDADRDSIATQLEGIHAQLLGNANAQNGNGGSFFSGYRTDASAFLFDETTGVATYNGDAGRRELRVDSSRTMPINDTGRDVFASVTAGARYVARAGADNAGSAVFAGIGVRDSAATDYGDSFEITFADNAGELSYSVRNTTTATDVVSGAVFEPGQTLTIGASMSLRIDGMPADGDAFTLGKGRPEDSNILNTIAGLAAQLRQPDDGPAAGAALANTLNSAQRQLDNSLDNVLSVRSSLGARLNELDVLDRAGSNRDVNYKSSLANLQDVDPVKAISDYSLAQVALQFSQKTFADIQQMSLFSLV
ncbi:flagellar hook-associated protein FlgL [Salinisphaera sp. T31B1]|uniref:flagellar hook-associated protein FlgL n=1 Tax=Salinisphaera sp. T31B1 TaxID=727963 RepID=UPI003340E08D